MKYCAKHKQRYMDFLPRCPICRGEEMGTIPEPIVLGNTTKISTPLKQISTVKFKRSIPNPGFTQGVVFKRTEKPLKPVRQLPPKGFLF